MSTLAPWKEDLAPKWADKKCLCDAVSGKRFVWGEGDPLGPLTLILDNPGAREKSTGEEFVCKTRITLRKALYESGISDTDVYVTFLFKCRPLRKYDRENAVKIHLPVLRRQIKERKPKFLLLMGNTVLKALFGEGSSVKDFRTLNLKWEGIPCKVAYHPLAASRRPNLFPLLVEDLKNSLKE